MSGEYSEKLKSGGEIKISSNKWFIEYYFPGIDLRYNGTFVRIDGSEIDCYISAWKENFIKYLTLKNSIPLEGSFETEGEMGMTIRIGGYRDGVCLNSFDMPINDKKKLSQIITDYKYAKERAKKIQELLFN